MSKQYGLLLPGKHKHEHVVGNLVAKHSAFNDDSDSDDEVKKPIDFNVKIKRQDKVLQKKAIEEDPTVYQYDEIYDKIEEKKKESKLARTDIEKKPKYISKLMAAADRRKRENERRIERQVQKEREEEGDEFKDKESFVTTAYRKKLEELKALEEQEAREEYLEAIGDVKKQGNLDGFYRHLYEQKVNFDDVKVKQEDEENAEVKENKEEEEEKEKNDEETKTKSKAAVKERVYRKRKTSGSDEENNTEEEEEGSKKKLEHLTSNLDADSDFSIDSSDSDDEKNTEPKKKKVKTEKEEEDGKEEKIEKSETAEKESAGVKVEEKEIKEEVVPDIPKKPKIDIWKKRTIGEVFDAALQRYFERKALRESGS